MVENIELIKNKLEDINKLIHPYQLAYVDPLTECELLKKNAHYMEKEKFDNLVRNVSEDGFLSQLPFAVKKEKYLIVSGNHRVKAAIKSKQKYILILFVEGIGREKEIAYQLSHNSLVGKDDLTMLKEIFDELESIQGKEFSGLNDTMFPEFSISSLPGINEKDIELQKMEFYFTNTRADQIDSLLTKLSELKLKESDARIVGVPFMAFLETLTLFKRRVGIKSNTVAFIKLIEIAQKFLEDGKENEIRPGNISEAG